MQHETWYNPTLHKLYVGQSKIVSENKHHTIKMNGVEVYLHTTPVLDGEKVKKKKKTHRLLERQLDNA